MEEEWTEERIYEGKRVRRKKETQCAELHLCCVLSCCESLLMLLLHYDSGLLLPMNAKGSNSVLYSLIRLGRVIGYMVQRYVIRSQKTVLCLNCRKNRQSDYRCILVKMGIIIRITILNRANCHTVTHTVHTFHMLHSTHPFPHGENMIYN